MPSDPSEASGSGSGSDPCNVDAPIAGAGTLILRWDNSYSWIRSKEICYMIRRTVFSPAKSGIQSPSRLLGQSSIASDMLSTKLAGAILEDDSDDEFLGEPVRVRTRVIRADEAHQQNQSLLQQPTSISTSPVGRAAQPERVIAGTASSFSESDSSSSSLTHATGNASNEHAVSGDTSLFGSGFLEAVSLSWTGAWSSEAADGQSYGQLQKGDNQAQSIGSPERKDMPAGLPAGAGIGMNLCVDGGQPQSKEAKEMWWRIAEQYIGE